MGYIVRYIKQSQIDTIERLKGERVSTEAIERMKNEVRVDSEIGAERLVQALRESGHIASYYHESEL